ncbi:MAG: hypothetical protein EZS28_015545 [Streblomastix strix]|uniref:Uncharacterized protein n=1 Tax=Streblomastix strix TaxID=222440 RepID=A0A5J4W1Z7_9EUKA|nr:MAG: hypothetical protein EZS28_015545 [Streblomastix strix]
MHDVERIISNDAYNMELTCICISKFALGCQAQRFSRCSNNNSIKLFGSYGAVTHIYRHTLRFIRCHNLSISTVAQPVTHYCIKHCSRIQYSNIILCFYGPSDAAALKIKHYGPSGAIAQRQLFRSIRQSYIYRIVAKQYICKRVEEINITEIKQLQTDSNYNKCVLMSPKLGPYHEIIEEQMIIQQQKNVCSDIEVEESVARIFQRKFRIDTPSPSAQPTATRGERDSFSPQQGFSTPHTFVRMGYIDADKRKHAERLRNFISLKDIDTQSTSAVTGKKLTYLTVEKGEIVSKICEIEGDIVSCMKVDVGEGLFPGRILSTLKQYIPHPFKENIFIKPEETIYAHDKKFLWYHPVDEKGANIKNHLSHKLMCCQTFANDMQCASNEYKTSTPRVIQERTIEFLKGLEHKCIPKMPKFSPSQVTKKIMTMEHVSMLFLVFFSCTQVAFRSINSDSFFNFVYAATELAQQNIHTSMKDLFPRKA